MFVAAYFHIYGLHEVCLTEACKPFHFGGISRTRLKIFNVLSCLPGLGQFFGYYMMRKGVLFFKENKFSQTLYFHKVEYGSMIVRGALSVLGLGILCFLMDIIVFLITTLMSYI